MIQDTHTACMSALAVLRGLPGLLGALDEALAGFSSPAGCQWDAFSLGLVGRSLGGCLRSLWTDMGVTQPQLGSSIWLSPGTTEVPARAVPLPASL